MTEAAMSLAPKSASSMRTGPCHFSTTLKSAARDAAPAGGTQEEWHGLDHAGRVDEVGEGGVIRDKGNALHVARDAELLDVLAERLHSTVEDGGACLEERILFGLRLGRDQGREDAI